LIRVRCDIRSVAPLSIGSSERSGGYILCVSNTIQPDTLIDNIMAMFEAVTD